MNSVSRKAKEIFVSLVDDVPQEEWDQRADDACQGDVELRQRVQALLLAHAEPDSRLQNVAIDFPLTVNQPISERPGDTIGPYKLLQQIGEGGMGVVYMAEQKEPVKRRVALKIIKPGMDTRQVIARFEAERQALAMMDHPNIAKVLDAGATDTGRPYFVMELVNGIPLTDYCDEQRLTPKERLELFVPVCQAIQHAHQKGVIHRDLKPGNILVAEYDHKAVPKVIDFGVAKATSQTLTEKTMFTQLGQIVGTLDYMSPEQAKRNQLDVDTRSDIYSLGVILYELLTGETPFDKQRLRSAAFDEMLRIIREEDPPRPSTKLSSSETLPSIAASRQIEPHKLGTLVRGELDWIVMKALEKDRGRRYETASAFAADVQHYLNDEAVVACPPSAGYRFRKFARRNKATIATATAIALSLIVGAGVAAWQAYEASEERNRAVTAEGLAESRLGSERAQRQRAERAEEQAKQEAQRATSQAAIATAVREFLQYDLLGMADTRAQLASGIEADPDVALRTLLDRAAPTLNGRFSEQPLVHAAVRETVGLSYAALGELDTSIEHLEVSLQLCQEHLGEDHTQTLKTMMNMAKVLIHCDRFVKAERLIQDVLLEHEHADHPDVLRALNLRAMALRAQGHLDEAETLLQDIVAKRTQQSGSEHVDTLSASHNLAMVYIGQSRYTEAEQLLTHILEVSKREFPPDHPDTLITMNDLANTFTDQGRNAEAEAMFRDALAVSKRVRVSDHPDTLDLMNNLALAIDRQFRHAEAEELFRQALQASCRVRGPAHTKSRIMMANLGCCLSAQQKFSAAEPLLQGIVNNPEHIPLDTKVSCHAELALVWTRQGRASDAVALCSRAINQLEEHELELPAPLALLYRRRGVAFAQLGDREGASGDFDAAVNIDPSTGSYNSRGSFYESLGEYEKAIQDYSFSLTLRTDLHQTWEWRAMAYEHLNLWEQALTDIDEAIKLQPDCANCQSRRSAVLERLER